MGKGARLFTEASLTSPAAEVCIIVVSCGFLCPQLTLMPRKTSVRKIYALVYQVFLKRQARHTGPPESQAELFHSVENLLCSLGKTKDTMEFYLTFFNSVD